MLVKIQISKPPLLTRVNKHAAYTDVLNYANDRHVLVA